MFTPIAIEGRFYDAEGNPESGTICVTPDSVLTNDGVEQTRAPICGVLDSQGRVVGQDLRALVVNATDDEGTLPVGSAYTFTIKLDGQNVVEFSSPIPSDPATWSGIEPVTCIDEVASGSTSTTLIDLFDLVASKEMIGATLTGLNTGTVSTVDEVANTITASGDSAYTGVHTLTISGGCVELAALQENAL